MTRLHARMFLLLIIIVAATASQLAAATSASAATTCRDYVLFRSEEGREWRDIRLCAAPAADFPRHSGWGRIHIGFPTTPTPCGYSILPYDVSKPVPGCMTTMNVREPVLVPAWQWTGTQWIKTRGFQIGSRAYIAPYAAGWRWAWTESTGWLAVPEPNVAFRWQG